MSHLGEEGYGTTRPHLHQHPNRPATSEGDSTLILAFKDFFPECLECGIFSDPEFERFGVVVGRANQWLAEHPSLEVKGCESLEVRSSKSKYVDPDKAVRDDDPRQLYMVRGLRLWYGQRAMPMASYGGDQIGYVNCVPKCVSEGGLLRGPKFEELGHTLSRLNGYLEENPIQGRIVTIETQDIKIHKGLPTGGVDPDKSRWYSPHADILYLFIFRVFYITGPPMYEQIGIVDFVPRISQDGRNPKHPTESFFQVVGRARRWAADQHGIRLCTLQTLDVKCRYYEFGSDANLDINTHKSSYLHHEQSKVTFVKVLRVGYVKPRESIPSHPPPVITHRTFVPCMLKYGGSFEGHQQTLQRIVAWLNATGAILMGVETFEIKVYRDRIHEDDTIHHELGRHLVYFLRVIRIYMHGEYEEPPAEVLPPVPQVEEGCNCAVS